MKNVDAWQTVYRRFAGSLSSSSLVLFKFIASQSRLISAKLFEPSA
ncbi:hypothetical protein NSP_10460 [Nodularia spumigena CCY9414]|nr:hypothetical protein NSP_10460 [Nodularia spumigena CCY9414]